MIESSAIEKTIAVLGKTHTSTSQSLLVHALNIQDEEIQAGAARILLYSSSALAKTEIIRNINILPDEVIREISQQPDLLRYPLQECLSHGNSELIIQALETIKLARLYCELPTLLHFLNYSTGEHVIQTELLFEELVDHLYDERDLNEPENVESLRNWTESIQNVIAESLQKFQQVKRPRLLVESLLILSHPRQAVARMLIRDTAAECLSILWDILETGRHPGVLHFLTDSLKQKYVHAHILTIIAKRDDAEFQLHFLDTVPERPSVNQQRNYKSLESPNWMKTDCDFWDFIPEHLQGQATRLVELLGMEEYEKITFYQSALQLGAVSARRVACEHRHCLSPEKYEQYIIQAIKSPDSEIKAWAVSELKHTKIADKSRILVECLESPSELVQQQARDSLGTFNLQHAIDYCESAPFSAGKKIADLLLKIDPSACQELSRELASPIRTRRLRAAKAAHMMGLQLEVQEGLIEMLYDSDPIIRRTIVEILAESPTRQIIASLKMLLDDPNPRVRSTTQIALEKIESEQTKKQISDSPY